MLMRSCCAAIQVPPALLRPLTVVMQDINDLLDKDACFMERTRHASGLADASACPACVIQGHCCCGSAVRHSLHFYCAACACCPPWNTGCSMRDKLSFPTAGLTCSAACRRAVQPAHAPPWPDAEHNTFHCGSLDMRQGACRRDAQPAHALQPAHPNHDRRRGRAPAALPCAATAAARGGP